MLVRLKADFNVVQEMQWKVNGRKRADLCVMYYIGQIKQPNFGVGFVVEARLSRRIPALTPLDVRLTTIRTIARFFNITLICVHTPTKEKNNMNKDVAPWTLHRLGPLFFCHINTHQWSIANIMQFSYGVLMLRFNNLHRFFINFFVFFP